MNRTFFRNAALATLVALASAGAPAVAQSTESDPPQLVIQTAGIDLATPQGQAMLHGKIKRAARAVCSSYDSVSELAMKAKYQACINKAVASTDAQVAALSNRNHLSGDALAAIDRSDLHSGQGRH